MRAFLRKWGICILFFLATTLNYSDRKPQDFVAYLCSLCSL